MSDHEGRTRAVRRTDVRLAVDRVRCTGHGVCAQLLPDRVRLDEWGYPLLGETGTAREVVVDAQAAQLAQQWCPARALWSARSQR